MVRHNSTQTFSIGRPAAMDRCGALSSIRIAASDPFASPRVRIFLAAVTAVLLTVLVATQQGWLVAEHNRLSQAIVELAGVPVVGVEMAPLFPGLQAGSRPWW